jgi:ADP-heptose:LPS heptosyltransferase
VNAVGPSPQQQVKYEFVRYTRGRVLDLGEGPHKAFPHFAAVRLPDDAECERRKLREIVTASFGLLPEIEDGSCDAIVATDTYRLLHGVPLADALVRWLTCLRDGGHLCLYEPDPEVAPLGAIMAAVNAASRHCPLDVARCEEWPAGGLLLVLRKGADQALTMTYSNPRPEKTCCIVRHGGYGDQIQAAALLPELKRQGYHVTFLTTEKGQDILREDPHIDEWYIVDRNQVPNSELTWFWKITARHYDKFVNLNESVESTFLASPGRIQHTWPHAVRHRLLNHNYTEHAFAVAELPMRAEGRFYPDEQEQMLARQFMTGIRNDMNAGLRIGERAQPVFVILWALAGSSPHKFTPHQDVVIDMILSRLKRAAVVLVGDEACKILEAGWEEAPRVYCRSGELSIRQTLTMALHADLVVGPETGVLNAVAYEAMPKVVMLSHSSVENLTKHWINTEAIPGQAHCYPCHQLHYTAEFCPQHPESGAALCQAGVHPDSIYAPIDAAYTQWVRVNMLRSAA